MYYMGLRPHVYVCVCARAHVCVCVLVVGSGGALIATVESSIEEPIPGIATWIGLCVAQCPKCALCWTFDSTRPWQDPRGVGSELFQLDSTSAGPLLGVRVVDGDSWCQASIGTGWTATPTAMAAQVGTRSGGKRSGEFCNGELSVLSSF